MTSAGNATAGPHPANSSGSSDSGANVQVLLAITLLHFTGDFYSSFISPLFPLLREELGLSLAQVGFVAGAARFLAFIVQPPSGYMADKCDNRSFLLGALLLVVVFIPLSGLAAGFGGLLFFVALGSAGSAMFHPAATGMIPDYAGRRAAFSMSIFNTGGTLAFAVGPLFITWYAARFGLRAIPATMILGLAVMAWLWFVLPAPRITGRRDLGFFATIRENLGDAWKAVFLIWLVMFLRAITGQSFLTFIPVLYVDEGFSVVAAGLLLSLFTAAGTFSGLLAGGLSDRWGHRRVFLVSHLLMTPALLFLLHMKGAGVYVGAVIAGGAVMATLPVGVALAQSLAPRGRSMVASLMMGFAYGLGGAFSPLAGKLADMHSIHAVLDVMAFAPLLTIPLILLFPDAGQGEK